MDDGIVQTLYKYDESQGIIVNKSHSVCYSVITYICAWLKAHYPAEFFCALMTVRSNTLQPKDWAVKAPQYVREAKTLGVEVLPPSVNSSEIGFHIENGRIFFGLEAIKSVGKTAARSVIQARGKKRFSSIVDFIRRVNTQKVNSKVFQALVAAGSFDRMGYSRLDLKEHCAAIYAHVKGIDEAKQREVDIKVRDEENRKKSVLIEQRDTIKKHISTAKRTLRLKKSTDEEKTAAQLMLAEAERSLEKYADMDLKRKPTLKPKEIPELPVITRSKTVHISLLQLIEQAEYIGCYIAAHPADILYPGVGKIAAIVEGERATVAGAVTNMRKITTKNGRDMAFLQISDDTGSTEVILFPSAYAKELKNNNIPKHGDIVKVKGKVESTDPRTKIILYAMDIHRTSKE